MEAPVDPTKELSRLVYEHKYKEDFTSALQISGVRIVSWLCSKVDLQLILTSNPVPLSQGLSAESKFRLTVLTVRLCWCDPEDSKRVERKKVRCVISLFQSVKRVSPGPKPTGITLYSQNSGSAWIRKKLIQVHTTCKGRPTLMRGVHLHQVIVVEDQVIVVETMRQDDTRYKSYKKRMQVGSKPVPNTTQQRPKPNLRTSLPSIQPQPERAFSEVVMEAKAAGYTEADSRDDLAGTDVAKKD
uniref:Homoserine dehydrogenase catalytic domain-containing protein n=1 Tax=Lactuca sativa TaxID=4236 RepID=A0A9R1VRU0_LACSA|nr:hypothetical protein LSAT_V11C400185350 [Lactuca sativa]